MIQTSWGYTLLDAESMPDILTQEEFNSMTANKYALDSRVQSAIKSVTAAVRNYCGWHIAGSQRCELVLNAQDLQLTRKYSDILIQLPFKYISDVEKVIFNATKENDEWVGDEYEYSVAYNGRLTVYDANIDSRKSTIVVIATVGLSFTDDIKSIICNKVAHVLSGTYGVQSETAGGLSISYSSSFVNGAKASALMTDDKELLNAYKVVELL
jgi:hypothetical protein